MPPSESSADYDQFPSIADAVWQVIEQGSIAALATLIATPAAALVGAKILVREGEGSPQGTFGDDVLDREVVKQAAAFLQTKIVTRMSQVTEFAPSLTDWAGATVLFERIQAEPRVVICGAGHVGAALARFASLLGYRATLIDDRSEFVSPTLFPDHNIELVAAQNWAESLAAAIGNGHGVSVAIVTRGHSEDEQCLRVVINSELDYIGLIGSKRRTNIVLQRLRDSGADEGRVQNVHAPVGLDIGAVTPEEVALAILAEIVAVRRGGKGGSLSDWRRK